MTHIKRMVVQGFKSFARKTEIPFENSMNIIVGPNGSGKCITGESLVSLGDGTEIRIDELVNSRMGTAAKTEEGFISGADGTTIMCLDRDSLKVIKKPIKAFVKKTSPEKLLRIKTRTGKEIKATPYHPFFILKDGNLVKARADELRKGVKIAIPRRKDFFPDTKYFVELIDEVSKHDNIYVPKKEEFIYIVKGLKKDKTWEGLSSEIGVSNYVVKGLLDGQAVLFRNLVKILRYAGLGDIEILDLINEVRANGKNTKFSFKNTKEFSRFFGYLLAEGRLTSSSQIWFTNGDKKLVKDYVDLVRNLFNKEPLVREYKPNCWDVIIYSEPLKKILRDLGGGSNSGDKKISNIILKHSDKEEISELLNGLYCGDGFVDKVKPVVEITTKSENLAKGVETCLLRLGLYSRISKIKKGYKDFIGEYFNISISGVSNLKKFQENIGLIHDMKRNRISYHINKKENSNADLIEVNDLVREICGEIGINVKEVRKDFPRIESYCYKGSTPSRQGLKLLLEKVFCENTLKIKKLKKLAFSDIFWDEILEFEEVKGDEWVYDLCVEKHHNFIANNIIAHNSNITDALCFVLGRLSIKSIRAAKASNLLFSGNESYKGSQEAYVELVFDNKDKSFAVEESEFIIRRTVRKNGQSIYRINGSTKTRQELLEMLSGAGIDPNGFNIVLQGEIQSLVKSTAEDRRKVIEEVAGISIYETRKHKSLRELEKTEERLKEVSTVLRERRAYLRNLEKEKTEAMSYKKLEETIKRSKVTILKKEINEKEKEIWGLDKVIGNHKGEIEKIKAKIEERNKKVEELQDKINIVNKRIQSSTSNDQEVLHKELSDLKAEFAGMSVRRENHESRVDGGKEKIQDLNKKLKELKEQLSQIKTASPEIKKHQERRHVLKEKFDILEKKRRRYYLIKSEISTVQNKKSDREKYLIQANAEIGMIERLIESMSHEIKYVRSEVGYNKIKNEVSEKIKSLSEGIIILESEILEKEKTNAILETDIKREEKLSGEVIRLVNCPVCKQEVSEDHKHGIKEVSGKKISSAKAEIEKNFLVRHEDRERIEEMKNHLSQERTKLNELNIDIVKIRNGEEKKEQIKKIGEMIKESEHEIKNLNEKFHNLNKEFQDLKKVEDEYDDVRLKLDELNFTDLDVDSEVAMKSREIGRIELELKSNSRDVEESEIELRKVLILINEKEKLISRKEIEEQKLYEKFQNFFSERNELMDTQKAFETDIIGFRHMVSGVEEKINHGKIQKAQYGAQIDSLKTDLADLGDAQVYNEPIESVREKLSKAQFRISNLGNVNMRALEIFDQVEEQCGLISEKVETINSEKDQIEKIIAEIDKKKKKSFMTTLTAVNEIFTRNHKQLSRKGEVFLDLENKKDPFEAGLNIMVKVGRGKYFDITSLSGGEKTMVSLALIFAIQEYKPYSFYIFDEIDAALDKANSELLAALIKKHMKSGQYIVITHNDIMITEATTIYGVSMQENISKIVSLKI